MNALHTQLTAAGIPVHGISIGRKDDKATWRVDFAPEATDEQKAQAAQIVAAFDVEKADHNVGIDAQIAALEAKETPRRIAESITSDVGMKWLVENRQKIAALRSQRK